MISLECFPAVSGGGGGASAMNTDHETEVFTSDRSDLAKISRPYIHVQRAISHGASAQACGITVLAMECFPPVQPVQATQRAAVRNARALLA